MVKRAALERHDDLTPEERAFLHRARARFLENTDWLEFEDFAFGGRSPLYSRSRSHQDVLSHPLYLALKDMWLDLGVRQGRISTLKGEKSDAARRKTHGRR
jgi:hypothetical protein